MAIIVAVRSGNWRDTSHVTGPWPGGSTPTTKPGVSDTVQTGEYVVTIDEDVHVAQLGSTATGYFQVTSAPPPPAVLAITASLLINSGSANGTLRIDNPTGSVVVTYGAMVGDGIYITDLALGNVICNARPGMANLIGRWRRMVDDASAAIWTDAQAQQILDANRADFWGDSMTPVPEQSGGSTIYTTYLLRRQNLEELSSGPAYWRVFDGAGTTIGTAGYAVDYLTGIIAFTTDQMGSARFLTGRAFDLYGAAADAWRERAASKASGYNFSADGGRFDRAQWFEHCLKMAEYYGNLAHGGMTVSIMARSDVA